MKRILLLLFALVSVIHLAAILVAQDILISVTKPLILLVLICYYFTSATYRSPAVIAALCFCWLGDVMLMIHDELFFILGLLAFLAGHVFYIVAYRQFRSTDVKVMLLPTQKIRFSLPFVLAGTGLVVVLYPKLGTLQLPVLIYATVIIVMVMNALFRYGYTSSASFAMVFIGAILFQLSDSLLAINKFHSSFTLSGFWVMLSYIAAQFMITEGIIRHK